jgi:hypothetical protein
MNVREANADDLGLMLCWCARRHEGSVYRHMPFSETRAAQSWAGLMDSEDGLLLVAEHRGDRVGGLGAHIADSRCMEGRVAALWTLYADTGRGACGIPLIRRYVEWAQARGAGLIEANNSASMDDAAFMKIVGRFGFKRSGSHAHLEV